MIFQGPFDSFHCYFMLLHFSRKIIMIHGILMGFWGSKFGDYAVFALMNPGFRLLPVDFATMRWADTCVFCHDK